MKYLLTFATLMTAACFNTGKEDTGEEEEEEEETAFAPSEGLWEAAEPEITGGDCDFGDDEEEDTGEEEEEGDEDHMNLTINDDGTFSITPLEDDEEAFTFNCTLSGMDFICDPTTMEEPMDGGDMTLVQEMVFSGTFSSETAFTGGLVMDMSCVGADCASLADFGIVLPCSMTGTVEGSFVE